VVSPYYCHIVKMNRCKLQKVEVKPCVSGVEIQVVIPQSYYVSKRYG
jgi:hypothetical protein